MLALHELFARRLEEKPWELLVLRGVDLHQLFSLAQKSGSGEDLPPLAYGAHEEPVLYPEGEDGDLDYTLSSHQVAQLLGQGAARVEQAVVDSIDRYVAAETPSEQESKPADNG